MEVRSGAVPDSLLRAARVSATVRIIHQKVSEDPMSDAAMIPESRRDAVRAALHASFGVTTVNDMRPVSGGVSGALILRFEIGGRLYVLRIEPERIALHHRQRGFACMVAASSVGAAPSVHYADAAAGVAVMDFVATRPLTDYPGGPPGLARALGDLVRRTQTAPPFPMLGNYPDILASMLSALNNSGLFAPGQLDRHAEGLARIRAALPWNESSLVSSHNDPNPRNILFDGERLWLIDWELACRSDALVDLAIISTDLAETAELERVLLEAVFGRSPDRALLARLKVIRLLTRLGYGCIVLDSLAQAPRGALLAKSTALTPAGFRSAVADGRIASGSPEIAYQFAIMSLRALIDGLSEPGFDDELKLAAES